MSSPAFQTWPSEDSQNDDLRQQLEQALREREAAQAKLDCLPADWMEDASLETWFPLTAQTEKANLQRVAELEAALKTARATIRALHGPIAWPHYQLSPEMQQINEALAASPEAKP